MYAILETGGKQFRVQEGDTLYVEKLAAEPGATVQINKVLAVQKDGSLQLGNPLVEGASVNAVSYTHLDVYKRQRYASSNGFECYPAPPGRTYHEESLRFARLIVDAIQDVGITVRGIDGIRFAYYMPNENGESEKTIKESDDLTVYDDPCLLYTSRKTFFRILLVHMFFSK